MEYMVASQVLKLMRTQTRPPPGRLRDTLVLFVAFATERAHYKL